MQTSSFSQLSFPVDQLKATSELFTNIIFLGRENAGKTTTHRFIHPSLFSDTISWAYFQRFFSMSSFFLSFSSFSWKCKKQEEIKPTITLEYTCGRTRDLAIMNYYEIGFTFSFFIFSFFHIPITITRWRVSICQFDRCPVKTWDSE